MRRLAQTCNFWACLRDSLIRDRLLLGINNNNIQKKLLQDRKLTLAKAIDVCRSSEKTKLQVKKISADNTANAVEINAFVNNKTGTGSRERGLSDLIGVMGGPIKPDADMALQLTSEKMSYLQPLEIVQYVRQRKPLCESLYAKGENPAEEIHTGRQYNLPIWETQ